jgi:hypothetical protein
LLGAIPGEFGYFDLPDHPAVPYLARSLAALYATWGVQRPGRVVEREQALHRMSVP